MKPSQTFQVIEAAQFFWEEVTSIDEVMEGVYWTKTVAHGGIIVDTSQVKSDFLSEETKQAAGIFGTMYGYEEDCACYLVIREHPELFPWEEYGGAEHIEAFCKMVLE